MQQQSEWEFLGAGSSHLVFVSKDGKRVFKVLIAGDNDPKRPFEDSKRSVRVWREIYDDVELLATEIEDQVLPEDYAIHTPARGWTTANIRGREATDEEIRALVLYIFAKTGRILLDAATAGNCKTRADGLCICVDIDLALKLDKEDNDMLSGPLPRASFVSLASWNKLHEQIRLYSLDQKERNFPLTVKTIKALLFIKSMRPDIINADFLKRPMALELLVSASEECIQPQNVKDMMGLALDLLEQERPAHLSNLKSTCAKILARYHSLEESSQSHAQCREDSQNTYQNVIQVIDEADTSDAILRHIEELRGRQFIKEHCPRLNIALGKCLLAIDALYSVNSRTSLLNIAVFFSKYVYNRSNLLRIMSVHTLDLFTISSKIWLPIYFLDIFDGNANRDQFFIFVIVILLLPSLAELKKKLLVDISLGVVEKFTGNLLEVGFNSNRNSIERFRESFTPEYVEYISVFIRETYGKLLPLYIGLVGFNIALGYKDPGVGGFAAVALFLNLVSTYYIVNPKYAQSFKANIAENKKLHEQVRMSIGRSDLAKFHDRVADEKEAIFSVLKSALPANKHKNYYDVYTKILGILTGNVTFLVGATYWISTYQQSEDSMTDYILLFYYLYTFSHLINQLPPSVSKLLSSAEYVKPLMQYSLWSEERAQNRYQDRFRSDSARQQARPPQNNTLIAWQLDSIRFDNIWYTNSHSKQALKNVSFCIQKNNFFAFVGDELGDQYALIRLLHKQAKPLGGKIHFNAFDINELDDSALYRVFAIIDSKDEFINGHTWFDTITYGNKDASDKQVLDAAYKAGLIEADGNVSALKKRFIRDNNSIPIEKRRLAIARAILKGGLCLILDNPTAGLSYHDEVEILKTLIPLSSQITTMMVTDKLYLLNEYVHRVFYLKDGTIKEQGTYKELIDMKQYFYSKLSSQRHDLQTLSHPSVEFYTIMEVEPSSFEKNFRPVGAPLNTETGSQLHRENALLSFVSS